MLMILKMQLVPYDDSYFAKRFAHNFLNEGVLGWNTAEGNIHGNTSQLFQLIIIIITAIAPNYTVFCTRILLASSLVFSFGILSQCMRTEHSKNTLLLSFLSPIALATIVSGMETATTFLLGALFLVHLSSLSKRTTGISYPLVLLSILLYLARPDTAILTMGSLLLIKERRTAIPTFLGALAALGITLVMLKIITGTALPLSFYAKSGLNGLYDEHFLSLCFEAKKKHFLAFLISTFPLFWLIGHQPSKTWRIVLPALGFIFFHLLITVDVMGMHARFYVPSLPWLALAARYSAQDIPSKRTYLMLLGYLGVLFFSYTQGRIPTDTGWSIGRVHLFTYMGFAGAVIIHLIPIQGWYTIRGYGILLCTAVGILSSNPIPSTFRIPTDTTYLRKSVKSTTSWRGIHKLKRCLGEDIHLYHSEIGVPGLLFLRGTVTDLGGLMNKELAFGEMNFAQICRRDQPDAIFLPHRNYKTLNRIILEGTCIQNYTRLPHKSSSPLYIRTDLLTACNEMNP